MADAAGHEVELSGITLEPIGRALDVGLAPAGIRTGAGRRSAVIGAPLDGTPGTETDFGDLARGHVVRRVRTNGEGPRINFSADGERYAFGGFDGHLGIVDVHTGDISGARDPGHTGPIASVTFSPGEPPSPHAQEGGGGMGLLRLLTASGPVGGECKPRRCGPLT